jgi:predicted TIM-barrel fold metal-dependent hydrolase
MDPSRPGIVSTDDHVVEPADLWQGRLPSRFEDRAPRLRHERGRTAVESGAISYTPDAEGDWTSVWYFEQTRVPLLRAYASAGFEYEQMDYQPVTYDQIRPGCYQQKARLADMDTAGIDASLSFPNAFVRFSGQRFLDTPDRDLALACLRGYNDWMIEEWSAGSGNRLIPLSVLPLWDAALAAEEVARIGALGCTAVSFPEIPPSIGLQSIHSGYWDPVWAACAEHGVVLNIHTGSGSRSMSSSADAPGAVQNSLTFATPALALADWVFSGKLDEFPQLQLSFAESQIGWLPYLLERMERIWRENLGWTAQKHRGRTPREMFLAQVNCCFVDDAHGVASLDAIGVDNVTFETDYPHSETTWPDSLDIAGEQLASLDEASRQKVLRGNALRLFRCPDPLERVRPPQTIASS